jgi:hypothetical protein
LERDLLHGRGRRELLQQAIAQNLELRPIFLTGL